MPKFRKRPVVIEAFKLDEDALTIVQVPLWLQTALESGDVYHKDYDPQKPAVYIKTLEGDLRASQGDYIIQGIQGELYPIKPDIFAETYDEVHDSDCAVYNGPAYEPGPCDCTSSEISN